MQSKLILIISILTLVASPLFSQSIEFKDVNNVDELKDKLQNVAENTNSLKNSFIQEKHLWMLEEVITSEGIFLFRKPGDVLWKYITPIDYSIAIFNNSFSIDNDGKVSSFDISSNPMFAEINKMILTAIRGDFIENKDFRSGFFENDQFYKAVLHPENENVSSMISSIEIYFNKTDHQVSKVKFLEPGDDFTLIKFQDMEVNIAIPDSDFIIENR
jgi:outer membrane lipoprotein carrier protein